MPKAALSRVKSARETRDKGLFRHGRNARIENPTLSPVRSRGRAKRVGQPVPRSADLAIGVPKRATILAMPILEFFMHVLEIMFFVGLAGSSVVVIISFFEDGKELFGKD